MSSHITSFCVCYEVISRQWTIETTIETDSGNNSRRIRILSTLDTVGTFLLIPFILQRFPVAYCVRDKFSTNGRGSCGLTVSLRVYSYGHTTKTTTQSDRYWKTVSVVAVITETRKWRECQCFPLDCEKERLPCSQKKLNLNLIAMRIINA